MLKPHAVAVALFWIVVIAAPALVSVVVAAQFPPGVDVPLHWGPSGEIDRWGSPWEMLLSSLIMSGANVLLAIIYRYSDKLYDLGLVHGISRKNTRPFLCGTAVFMVLLMIGILAWWVAKAQAAS